MIEESKRNSYFGISSAKTAFSGMEAILLKISECDMKIKKRIQFRNACCENGKGIIIFAILPKQHFWK